MIIENNKTIRKHPTQGYIALRKGLHPVKIIYLNIVHEGWATDWNPVELRFKTYNQDEYKILKGDMLYHIASEL